MRPEEGYFTMPGGNSYRKKGATGDERYRRSLQSTEATFEKFGEEIKVLKNNIEEIKRPQGNRDNPARYCKDMFRCNDNKYKNGFYWIDPNQGGGEDAVFAYCDFLNGGETCVYPDDETKSAARVEMDASKAGWFSEANTGSFIGYKSVTRSQMKFLRLLSEEAAQNVTVKTSRSFFANSIDFRRLTLQSGVEMVPTDAIRTLPSQCTDKECVTTTHLQTEDMDVLPVTDFRVHTELRHHFDNRAEPRLFVSFDVGPICFK